MFNEVFTKEKLESLGMSSLNVALIDAAFQEVFSNYKGKIKNIKNKMYFKYKGEFDGTFNYYTRNTKNHKKGELKSVNVKEADKETKKRRTNLCSVLSYLTRYGNNNILEYIDKNYETSSEDKKNFYNLIRHYVEKFGLERLLKTAETKRLSILYKYRKPVEYKSLTFNGFSRKQFIINENKNKKSRIDAFITLTWLKDVQTDKNDTLCIPIKYNKEFYKEFSDYNKTEYAFRYTIKLFKRDKFISDDEIMTGNEVDPEKIKKLGLKPNITVILKRKDERYYPVADDSLDDLIGCDVNFKHNAIALDDGTTFDWDRDLIKRLSEQYRQIDEYKKKDKDYKPGKKKQNKIDSIKEALRQYLITLSKNICTYMISKGKRHIVFEDIDG